MAGVLDAYLAPNVSHQVCIREQLPELVRYQSRLAALPIKYTSIGEIISTGSRPIVADGEAVLVGRSMFSN